MERPSNDEYFMEMAQLVSSRSTCLRRKVGAVIVKDKRVLSTGYNGFPRGCSDDEYPWEREGNHEDTKYPYVVHAELNAILNASGKNLSGAKLYVALFPCNECAKAIIQSGIQEIVYLSDKYDGTPMNLASKRMLNSAGVNLRKLVSDKTITLPLNGRDI